MPGGLHPPPQVIVTWPAPNYINPEEQGPALVIVSLVFTAIGVCLVTARVYSRLFITRAPGLDDVFCCFSLGFAIATTVLIIIANQEYGVGRHMWDNPFTQLVGARLVTWATEWCYVLASASVKISILLFYRRLSVSFTKTFYIATWIGIIYNALYAIAFCLVIVRICSPTVAYWKQFDLTWLKSGHTFTCGQESISLPASGALSVLGDFYSTVLPFTLIRTLDMPFRQKISLYALFAFGFLVVAAGIVRTILLDIVINKTYDVSWSIYTMWVWTIVELYVAIMAASAPALKPLFRKFLIDPISKRYGYDNYGADLNQHHNGGTRKMSIMNSQSHTHELRKQADVEMVGVTIGGKDDRKLSTGSEREDVVALVTRLMKHIRTRSSFDVSLEPIKSSVKDDDPTVGSHHPEVGASPGPDKRGFMQLRRFGKDRYGPDAISRYSSASTSMARALHHFVTGDSSAPARSVSSASRICRATNQSSITHSHGSRGSGDTLQLTRHGSPEYDDLNGLHDTPLALAL